MSENKKNEWHLKIYRALPGFSKSEIDDYSEYRFKSGKEEVKTVAKEITDRMKKIRLGEIDNMVYSLELLDAYISYDLNAVIAVIAYER